jgi:hypothetical protein
MQFCDGANSFSSQAPALSAISGTPRRREGKSMEKRPSGFFTRLLARTPESMTEEINIRFDHAKRTSDFIGMVVRLAFAIYATSYFWSKVMADPAASLTYTVVTMWICCLCLALVTVKFFLQIGTVTGLYIQREAALSDVRRAPRAIFLTIYSIVAVSVASGLVSLILALPKPTG